MKIPVKCVSEIHEERNMSQWVELQINLCRGRRQWHPTPVLLPGKSHGRRRLVGCSPWGLEESQKSWLSNFTFTFHFHALEKEMATHSSVLAWRIPGTGEPGGLPTMGRKESDTTEATEQQQQSWPQINMFTKSWAVANGLAGWPGTWNNI